MASRKRGTSVESPNEVHLRRREVVVFFGDGRAKPPVGQEVILGQQPKARTHFPDARQVEHQHSGLVTSVSELGSDHGAAVSLVKQPAGFVCGFVAVIRRGRRGHDCLIREAEAEGHVVGFVPTGDDKPSQHQAFVPRSWEFAEPHGPEADPGAFSQAPTRFQPQPRGPEPRHARHRQLVRH